MIFVTDLKVINTDKDDIHWLTHARHMYGRIGIAFDPESCCEVEITREMVRGQRFSNHNGRTVVIGWDELTQKVLGLPFKVFEAQNRRRESDYRENEKLRKSLREWEEMSFWQLIKRAITVAFR